MIVLAADDFALSDRIDAAVLDLAARGRLSATSAMTNLPRWPEAATALNRLSDRLALGLHLTLTEGPPLSDEAARALADSSGQLPSLPRLLRLAVTGRLDDAVIAAEARAQILAFAEATGRMPDMIDGHQHAHVLPGVRDGLLSAIRTLDWPAPPLVRSPANRTGPARDSLTALPKRGLVALLATGFRARLSEAGLPTNDTFAGFSTFRPGPAVGRELTCALEAHGEGIHIVMCHPATAPHGNGAASAPPDTLAARRRDEYLALSNLAELPARIWHPDRASDGVIRWPERAP